MKTALATTNSANRWVACAARASLVVALLGSGGCAMFSDMTPSTSTPAPAPVAATYPSSIPTEKLVGKWGIASFHVETDKARTIKEARSQCSQPYEIVKGPTDGVIMHVADDPVPHELKLKGTADGRTFLGFEAPPGHKQDREILSFEDNMIVMSFVTPAIAERYGTFVYVRCTK